MTMLLVTAFFLAADFELVDGAPELVAEGHEFSEGPLWVPGTGWIFSDIPPNIVHRLNGDPFRTDSGGANGLALDKEGRVVFAEGEAGRVTRLEADGSLTVLADSYNGQRFNAPNDLVVAADGTIFFTDPLPPRPHEAVTRDFAGVYAIYPDGELELLIDDMKYPNGIGLSPDEATLYIADTMNREIRAYDLADVRVSNPRNFCEVTLPDGFAVDRQGRIWCAASGGVSVFDSNGALLEKIRTKRAPTNCAIGGENGSTLLITARQHVYAIHIIQN